MHWAAMATASIQYNTWIIRMWKITGVGNAIQCFLTANHGRFHELCRRQWGGEYKGPALCEWPWNVMNQEGSIDNFKSVLAADGRWSRLHAERYLSSLTAILRVRSVYLYWIYMESSQLACELLLVSPVDANSQNTYLIFSTNGLQGLLWLL